MSRTMINSVLLTAVAAALAGGLSGCSKQYAHKRLGTDSPEAEQVRKMIAALRSAETGDLPGVMAGQSAGGLTEMQAKSLRASLERIAKAEKVELVRVDQFGQDVHRAVLDIHAAGRGGQLCMLLVPDGSELRWAGPN